MIQLTEECIWSSYPSQMNRSRLSDSDRGRINQLSNEVIGAALKAHSALGPGLLESVYEVCLAEELRNRGHRVLTQVHKTQLLSYLRFSERHLGLLINFHVDQLKDGIVRVVNQF